MISRQDAKEIVECVSKECGLGLALKECHENCIVTTSRRGAEIVITYQHLRGWGSEPKTYFVKSVLRRVRKRAEMSWSINGQCGKNCHELRFWPEGDFTFTCVALPVA